ncbi:MAG: nucleotidyltransferase domain-containing protein [Bacteroidaceae bacterium]|nr:nucleotidyltransferase domain-containing protein [Bacteroidaceae bacterium]
MTVTSTDETLHNTSRKYIIWNKDNKVGDFMSKEKLDAIFKEVVINTTKIFGDKLVAVILYGSYARGDYSTDSDIDIALLVDMDRISLKKYDDLLVSQMTYFMLEHDVLISFNDIPVKEFEEYKDVLPYYRNIVEEGVRLIA